MRRRRCRKGGSSVRSSLPGGTVEAAAVRDGGLDAAWASSRLSAHLARSSSS